MFEIIFLISIIICLGFASRFIFERTRIPESIILLAAGICLGPLGLISAFSIPGMDMQYLQAIAPIVGALAIVSIVFEAGFRLKAKEVAGNVWHSVIAAILHVFASIIVIFLTLHFVLGWNPRDALVLSSILGGISSYAVYSIIPLVRTTNVTRSRFYLEAALSAIVICIIAISSMKYIDLEAANKAMNAGTIVFWLFSVSFIIGLIAGAALLLAMLKFKVKRAGFLPLFALVLAAYYVDFVYLGGIGVISVAIIGFVLANSDDFFRALKMRGSFEVDDSFRFFQEEISLFIGTFFFVYLGMIFRPEQLSITSIGTGIVVVLAVFFARASVVGIMDRIAKSQSHENFLQSVMLPRDILSAGLATFIFIYPNSAGFGAEIVTIVIVLSTIAASIGVREYERIFRDSLLFRKEARLKDGREIVIRSFTRDDFGKLKAFFNELVDEGAYIAIDQRVSNAEEREIDEESLAKINRKEMICWVVEHQNKIVGRAVAEKMPRRERDNVSLSFYISKAFRGAGLGTLLIRMIIKEGMRVFRPHNLYLTVYSDNRSAIKLYEREGFQKTGVLPGWMKHNEQYLDRIYMVYRPKGKRGKTI